MKKIIALVLFIMFVSSSVLAKPLKSAEINTEFFTKFNDEYLTQYIQEALKNNHELKIATLKVEEYRQQARISLGRELPSLSVNASYLGIKVPQLDNFELSKSSFVLPFVLNYEADLLLKNRDKTRSAKKSYEASKEEEKVIYISLVSDVATSYINILQYDYLINLQSQVVKIEKEQVLRAEKMLLQGVVNADYLNNVMKKYETEENTLDNLQKQEATILNNFAVLIGLSPNNISEIKRGNLIDFEYGGKIPNEISSEVLFSRPDVLAIEKKLEKAKIDVRIARKEFLPTFNITGLWAFNTIAPGAFFSWESSLAMLLAGASQDIFKGGIKIANLKIQKNRYEQMFEQYRQTDLNATKEINTALCLIKHDTSVDKSKEKQLIYEQNNYKNSEKKFKNGTTSYPQYLDAEESLLRTEQTKIQTKTIRLIDYITLYKAVGGAL